MMHMSNEINKFISMDNLALFAEILKTLYATKQYVDDKQVMQSSSNLFIGTQKEYNSANNNGLISPGSLVIILGEDELSDLDKSTSELGKAVLGLLKLK